MRIAELEAECAIIPKMEKALIEAAHRLAVLGDLESHPVRKMIEDVLNEYAPVLDERP